MTGRKSRALLACVGAALLSLGHSGCGRTTNTSGQAGSLSTVGCVRDEDCASKGLLCQVAQGRCVACRTTEDCATTEQCRDSVCEGAGGAKRGEGGSGGAQVSPTAGADSEPDSNAGMGGDSLAQAGTGPGPTCSEVALPWPAAPVDFIVAVDNSGSMVDEIEAIELALNGPFASALYDSKLDYRVILVSRHRMAVRSTSGESATSLCITAPLSALASCPAETPVFSDHFFHYSIKVESTNAFDVLLATYGTRDLRYGLAPLGWSAWLRPDSRAVLTVITDDDDAGLPNDFVDALSSLSAEHFGLPKSPSFTFHSIVGLAQKTDPGSAYLPTEPLQTLRCTGGSSTTGSAGLTYQQLSVQTSGLRFPICETERLDGMFEAIVHDAVAKSTPRCESEIPVPTSDLSVLDVSYTPALGVKTTFARVATSGDCAMHAFYVEGARVRLCPETCAQVRTEPGIVQLHTCAP